MILLLIPSQFILPTDRNCHVLGPVQEDINKVAYFKDRRPTFAIFPISLPHSSSSLCRLPLSLLHKRNLAWNLCLLFLPPNFSMFQPDSHCSFCLKGRQSFPFSSRLLRPYVSLYLVLSVMSSFIYCKFPCLTSNFSSMKHIKIFAI